MIELIKNRLDMHLCVPSNSTIAEIGVKEGSFFKHLLKTIKPQKAYAIDCWDLFKIKSQNDSDTSVSDLIEMKKRFVSKYKKNSKVIIINDFSDVASQQIENESLDFAYLDADHSYDGCKKDLECWYPKIKKNGILAGHDYANVTTPNGVEFNVIKAVNEFFNNIHITTEQYPTWIVRKN
jgi:hypothetical protein